MRSASATTPASRRGSCRARRGAPLHDELATIDSAADATELAAALGTLQRAGGRRHRVYVDTDSRDSTRYLVHFTQSGIGLPDEFYYRDEQHRRRASGSPGAHRRCSA